MKFIIKNTPALLLLIGAIVLMQAHAIEFWSTYAGKLGVLWSLLLEGAALWLWAQRSVTKNVLALIASVLVLAGPLYQVSAPAVEQLHASTAAPAMLAKQEAALTADRDRLLASLETYNANSQSRVGWAARIDEMNSELNRVNSQLTAVYQQQAATTMPWQALAVIAMQAIGLLIFQTLIVLCIRAITAQQTPAIRAQKTVVSGLVKPAKNHAKPKSLLAAA